jgi:hypothetical protein
MWTIGDLILFKPFPFIRYKFKQFFAEQEMLRILCPFERFPIRPSFDHRDRIPLLFLPDILSIQPIHFMLQTHTNMPNYLALKLKKLANRI